MKKIFSSLVIVILLISSINSITNAQSNKNFSFSPGEPKAGKKIEITYNPAGNPLEKSEKISMLVHAYGKTLYYTDEIDLKKEGTLWQGSFSAADTCAGVVLRFTDGENYDNNGTKCFPIRFYGTDGKLVKYASTGLAGGYASWFSVFNIDPDAETAFKLYQEELATNPSVKKEIFFQYFNAYNKVDKEKAAEYLKKEAENFEKTLTQSEGDLGFLMQLYTNLKMKDKMEKVQALILEKYPTSTLAEGIKFMEVYGTKDAAEKALLAEKFKTQFPKSRYLTYLFPDTTEALIQAGKYEEAYSALKQNPKATSQIYNNLAWAMYEKDANMKLAKEIAAKGVELSTTEDPLQGTTKPPYYSEKEFQKMLSASRYAIIDTYGAILLKLGENEEALKYMTKAYELDKGKSADVNERYTQALVKNNKFSDASSTLEKFISEGQSTPKMKDLLKEVYVKFKNSDAGFDNYYEALTKKAQEKKFAEIKKEMINDPAPKFSLVDLDGKNVSLDDLKGKIVIIDFWATWCGPCKASFPGMQKTVEKFANDNNIHFLFVNTWQTEEDKKKNAADFISQNKYTFHVLLDNDNKVVDSYKVSGIPTKFVIDKNGNIRFKAIGFDGNTDGLVEELSAMISLLN